METSKTNRGFKIGKFTDAYGVDCSLQESSIAAEEGHVWFGCNKIELKRFEPGKGWVDVELENDPMGTGVMHSANTRMHLSQSMVRDLCRRFSTSLETGELPSPETDQ